MQGPGGAGRGTRGTCGQAPALAGLPAAGAAWVSGLSSCTLTLGLSLPWGTKQMAEEKETLVTFKGK